MKKTMKLILALALAVACLTCFALADKPAEVAEADAGVKVTLADGTVSYHETLTPEMMVWMGQELNQDVTMTLLKDLCLDNEEITGAQYLRFDNVTNTGMITLDLNGKTLSFTGASNIFNFNDKINFTCKNGKIVYKCTASDRCIFNLNTSSGDTSDFMTGELFNPVVVIENCELYNLTEAGGRMICSFSWDMNVTIKDSLMVMVGKNSPAIWARLGPQTDAIVPYTGALEAKVVVENSTIATLGGQSVFQSDVQKPEIVGDPRMSVTVKNSTFVTDGVAPVCKSSSVTLTAETEATTEAWTAALPDGTAVSGTATIYAAKEVPSTNVPDVDVPKTGVSIAALGILAVTSMAGVVIARKKED